MAPIGVLAAELVIQLSNSMLGKAEEDGPSNWTLSLTWETQKEFLVSGLAWFSSGCCNPLKNETVNGTSLTAFAVK